MSTKMGVGREMSGIAILAGAIALGTLVGAPEARGDEVLAERADKKGEVCKPYDNKDDNDNNDNKGKNREGRPPCGERGSKEKDECRDKDKDDDHCEHHCHGGGHGCHEGHSCAFKELEKLKKSLVMCQDRLTELTRILDILLKCCTDFQAAKESDKIAGILAKCSASPGEVLWLFSDGGVNGYLSDQVKLAESFGLADPEAIKKARMCLDNMTKALAAGELNAAYQAACFAYQAIQVTVVSDASRERREREEGYSPPDSQKYQKVAVLGDPSVEGRDATTSGDAIFLKQQ